MAPVEGGISNEKEKKMKKEKWKDERVERVRGGGEKKLRYVYCLLLLCMYECKRRVIL